MGKCVAGYFRDNSVVKHATLVCGGGYGVAQCLSFETCKKEYAVKKRKPVIVRDTCQNLDL